MNKIKICIFYIILISLSSEVVARPLRERRQALQYQMNPNPNGFWLNAYNNIRDHVVTPVFNMGVNRFSQNWDRIKQEFNQGINRLAQNWNQFTQSFYPQYSYVNNQNYPYNQYGYNAPQYFYPINGNNDIPPNSYQYYDNNNYYNSYGQQRGMPPYYGNNMGGYQFQNSGKRRK